MIRTPFGEVQTPMAILPYFYCPKCGIDVNLGDCSHNRQDFTPPIWIREFNLWLKGKHEVEGLLLEKFKWLQSHANVALTNPSFESDYTGWTTVVGNSGSIAIDATQAKDGAKSSKSTAGAINSYAYARQNFTDIATGTVFVRQYFRFDTTAVFGAFKGFHCGGLRGTNDTVNCLSYGISGDGAGNPVIELRVFYPANAAYQTAVTVAINTWYAIEAKAVIAVSGEYRAWLDGVEKITQTGVDSSGMPAPDNVRIGLPGIADPGSNSASWNLWCDAVVIDDASYIGPIAAPVDLGYAVII